MPDGTASGTGGGAAEVRTQRPRRGRRIPGLWPALRIALVAVAAYLLLPQLAGLEATGRALARTTWWVPPTVILLEAGSLFAYAQLLREVLAAFGQRAPYWVVQRAVLA